MWYISPLNKTSLRKQFFLSAVFCLLLLGKFFALDKTPVAAEIVSFEAVLNNKEVYFYWTTQTENNAEQFIVECSVDGKFFEEVIILPAVGNSNVPIEYFDVDQTPESGQSFYRLKITDSNGNTHYTSSVPVMNTGEQIRINIEQTGSNCPQNVSDQENILMILRDPSGTEYYSKFNLYKKDNLLAGCDLEQRVPAGIYVVTGASKHIYYSSKLVVE